MYKPVLEDVQVSDWETSPSDSSKDVMNAVIYLVGGKFDVSKGDGVDYSVGHRKIVEVDKNANLDQRRAAIEKCAYDCVASFDVADSAKKLGYWGDLDFLRPLELPNLHKFVGRNV